MACPHPDCGAAPGELCVGKRRPRISVHQVRIDALAEHQAALRCDPAEVARLRALPYAEYLRSEHWLITRAAALRRAGGRCCLCAKRGKLEVHHNTYERLGCELPEDLAVLCGTCHPGFHGHPPRPS